MLKLNLCFIYQRRQRAEGRRQKECPLSGARDRSELGSNTPTSLSCPRSVGVESPSERNLLPSASCLLPSSMSAKNKDGQSCVMAPKKEFYQRVALLSPSQREALTQQLCQLRAEKLQQSSGQSLQYPQRLVAYVEMSASAVEAAIALLRKKVSR